MTRIPCPHCGQIYKVPDNSLGKKMACLKCRETFDLFTPLEPVVTKTPPKSVFVKSPPRALMPAAPGPPPPVQNAAVPAKSEVVADASGAVFVMKGVQDTLRVFEDRVTITPRGVLGFFNKGITGTKEIPFSSITAIQFREAGPVISGFMQFTIPGGNESRGGIFAATKDENTFMFASPGNNLTAKEIKSYIDSAIRQLRTPQTMAPARNLSDELSALARLKESGVLSDAEFQAAKKRLIG